MSRLRELHPRFTVDETCGLFGHSRQAYYKVFKREYDSSAEVDKVLNLVRRIREKHPKMGVRKLKVLLKRDHDIDIGRDCLFDTMRDGDKAAVVAIHIGAEDADAKQNIEKFNGNSRFKEEN